METWYDLEEEEEEANVTIMAMTSNSKLRDHGYDIVINQKSCKVISKQDGSITFNKERKKI